ncbi:MAG: hypothetical protein WB696_30485, partial [Chthoniobacterales bacterium]
MPTRSWSSAKFRIFNAIEKSIVAWFSASVSWLRTTVGTFLFAGALAVAVTGSLILSVNVVRVAADCASAGDSGPKPAAIQA